MYQTNGRPTKRSASTDLEYQRATKISRPNREVPIPEDYATSVTQNSSWMDCTPSTSGTSMSSPSTPTVVPFYDDSDSDVSFNEIQSQSFSSSRIERNIKTNLSQSDTCKLIANYNLSQSSDDENIDVSVEMKSSSETKKVYMKMVNTSYIRHDAYSRSKRLKLSKPIDQSDELRENSPESFSIENKFGSTKYTDDTTDDEEIHSRTNRRRRPPAKRFTKRVQFAETPFERQIYKYAAKHLPVPAKSDYSDNLYNRPSIRPSSLTPAAVYHSHNCLDIYLPEPSNCTDTVDGCFPLTLSGHPEVPDQIPESFLHKMHFFDFLDFDLAYSDADLAEGLRHLEQSDSQWSAITQAIRQRQQHNWEAMTDEDDSYRTEETNYRIPMMKKKLKDFEEKHPLVFHDNGGDPIEGEYFEIYSDLSSNDVGYSSDGWNTADDNSVTDDDDC